MEPKTAILYETDVAAWADEQARAIAERRWHDVDVEHVAEEIADLSLSRRRELGSRLKTMIVHLLKQKYQPERATRSWGNSIVHQASEIDEVLEESPSLRREVEDRMVRAYTRARRAAAQQTGLPIETFPSRFPKIFRPPFIVN